MAYLDINDLKIYYEIHGSGQPLLLIHGLGSSTRDWERQVTFFSNYYQVITFDLRGHGKTNITKGPYSVPQFANDVASLIRALKLSTTHIVGHSLGGMIAFQLALDEPELIKTLTIVNSAPAAISGWRYLLFKFTRKFSIKLFGMKKLSNNLANNLFPKPEQTCERMTFIARWCDNQPEAYLYALQAFDKWNVISEISKILCPTLVISADQDYTPVALKEMYVRLMPNAELAVIKDSRHMTIIDQADTFNQTLLSFLQKQDVLHH